MKVTPMLQVADVTASSRWYQDVLGLQSGHGGDEFEMLVDGDTVLVQLHRLDAHEHGIDHTDGPLGAGVSLWFESADEDAFRALFARGRAAGATVIAEPRWNPLAHHHEAALRDPDGYVVMLNSPFTMES